MTEIVPVPFHGDTVLTVEHDGKPHIILKPAVESIGLDYWAQVRKLRTRSWACTASKAVQMPGDDQRREVITCDVRTFLMLLATVDENRIGVDVKPRLIAYQAEVADAIEQYWTQGGAINPRASESQLDGLSADIQRRKGELEVLRLCDGLVDPNWLEAKVRHVAARALGEEPEVDPDKRPLTVGEYLQDHGLTATQQRSLASQFGKRLKALYREKRGQNPPEVERFVDGALRKVAGYTEHDRPLFDEVFSKPFGTASRGA